MGKFKEKPRSCHQCGAKWFAHEEKETDVHIAVRLVSDALVEAFDKAIIISADSDLAPALRIVKKYRPKKHLLVVAPPGRFGCARDLGAKLELTKGRLRKCLLPAKIVNAGKCIVRPPEYDP